MTSPNKGTVRRIIPEPFFEPREVPKGTPARFRGRRVQPCTPEGCSLLKITVVALLILGLILVPVAILLQPYAKPSRPTANHFATSLSPYVVPGFRTLPHGRAACRIQTPPISERTCLKRAARLEKVFNNTLVQNGLNLEKLQEQNDKSVLITEGVMLGMRPLRIANYKKALEYAEKVIVRDSSFLQDPARTIQVLKNLNRIISEGLPQEDKPGNYRTHWQAVTDLIPGTSMTITCSEELNRSELNRMSKFFKTPSQNLKRAFLRD